MQKDNETWRAGRENRGMGHYSYAVLEGDRLVAKGEREDVERIVRDHNERDALKAQEQINNALMDEGATKIFELQEEVRRLKEHVRDLDHDLNASTKECNDFHVDGRTL